LGEPDCLLQRGAWLNEPAQEPEIERTASVDRLAGEDHVYRHGGTDRAGKTEQPPAAAMRLRFTSASPNADRVVATTRSPARTISSPPGNAVDGDDDGLRALAVHEAGELVSIGVEHPRVARLADH
jgi:hypothetical protein